MDDKFPTGAYVILNKHHSTVLHVKDVNVEKHNLSSVALFGRDENRYRNHQIWWIEPLPLEEDTGEYSITSISTGWALDVMAGGWGRVGKELIAKKPDGGEGQVWRIQRFWEDTDG